MKKTLLLSVLTILCLGISSAQAQEESFSWNVGQKSGATFYVSIHDRIILSGGENIDTLVFNAMFPNDSLRIYSKQDTIIITEEIKNSFGAKVPKTIKSKRTKNFIILEFNPDPKPTEPSSGKNSQESNVIDTTLTLIKDAILIKTQLNKNDSDSDTTIKNVLQKYGIDDNTKLSQNKLLKKALPNLSFAASVASGNNSKGLNLISRVGNEVGGLDVTSLVDGLAKFLVKRTKDELNIAFFNKFVNEVRKEENEDFRVLFPATTETLLRVGNDIYNYERYLESLKIQFQTDFGNLIFHTKKLIQKRKEVYFQGNLGSQAVALASLEVLSGFVEKKHPGDILESLNYPDMNFFDTTLYAGISTLQLISYSFRESDKGKKRYWVDPKDIRTVAEDELTFKIYMGLLAQMAKEKNIIFKSKKSLSELLNSFENKISKLRPHYFSIAGNIEAISALIKEKKQSNKKLDFENISRYVDETRNLLNSSMALIDSLEVPKTQNLKKFVLAFGDLADLNKNIVNKKYGLAILNTLSIYESLIVKTLDNNNQLSPPQSNMISKYGPFMASIILAQNSDEIASIIEAYALPSGSYRTKRYSNFSITLNSYLGVGESGRDVTKVFKDIEGEITAAIGPSLNFGLGKKKLNRSSISLFIPLFDIGAAASFRFKESNGEIAKIYLKEIVAPGAILSYGIPTLPIAVNVGWQQLPALRRVEGFPENLEPDVDLPENTVIVDKIPHFRVSINVDIPLFNIYATQN